MQYQFLTPPFHPSFYKDYVALSEAAFGHSVSEKWTHSVKWRLDIMPDLTVLLAKSDNHLIGYKAGYATAYNRYYSWMGAVHPDFRRQGIARKLMEMQHEWIDRSRFKLLETQVAKSNIAMIKLNGEAGLKASGVKVSKTGAPYLIMEKWLSDDLT